MKSANIFFLSVVDGKQNDSFFIISNNSPIRGDKVQFICQCSKKIVVDFILFHSYATLKDSKETQRIKFTFANNKVTTEKGSCQDCMWWRQLRNIDIKTNTQNRKMEIGFHTELKDRALFLCECWVREFSFSVTQLLTRMSQIDSYRSVSCVLLTHRKFIFNFPF